MLSGEKTSVTALHYNTLELWHVKDVWISNDSDKTPY